MSELHGISPVPVFPHRHVPLTFPGAPMWAAAAELAAPLALGARGLIAGPDRTGRTMLLRHIAAACAANASHATIHAVLVDRPIEEHMEWRADVPHAVIHGTTTEDDPHTHAQVHHIFDDAAMRAAHGDDVVVLVDSLTALARALNASMEFDARILSGGMMATALRELRELFGRARAYESQGSLTILGTVTVNGEQEADTVVFEELVGTGNIEYRLAGDVRDAGIIPALDLERSGTRRTEVIVGEADADLRARQRARVTQYGRVAGMSMLLEHLDHHQELPDA
jgi:transcription termination factor Rho